MSTENPKIEYWQMTPEQKVEHDVSSFEEMTSVNQAETAKFLLNQLKGNTSALTEDHKRRLITACEIGIKNNSNECKESLLFKRFKKEDIPNLFQSL